ncbi:MAG: hypothetical protein Hals2KO_07860 [Halioglobus sp.]
MASLRKDYSGDFDPDLQLSDFSREYLATLMHEYNLIGHLLDRSGQPLVAVEYGEEGFVRSAIDEWQCASPIYSKRMQRLMGFEGSDVGTVFKNIQLEIGAPQQFLDFQFRLDSPEYGEFWLSSCGALNDLEANGNDEKLIKAMCHDIEDPTFDATAAATHPNMIMRPVHRPPRIDSDIGNGKGRYPVCRWMVMISDEHQPFVHHPNLEVLAKSHIANVDVLVPDGKPESGGWDDYAGAFDPQCQFEDFSQWALVQLLQENAVQTTLLALSYTLSQSTNYGSEISERLTSQHFGGHAAVAVERLQKHMPDLAGDCLGTMAKVLQLLPIFQPKTYIDTALEFVDSDRLRLSVFDCPALNETIEHGWFTLLGKEPHSALNEMVAQVNPRAYCIAVDDPGSARFAWDIVIDPAREPAQPSLALKLARTSTGLNFRFEKRRLPEGLIARG